MAGDAALGVAPGIFQQRLPARLVAFQFQALAAPMRFLGDEADQPRFQLLPGIAPVVDLGLYPGHFGIGGDHLALRRVHRVAGGKMRLARRFYPRLQFAQPGGLGLQPGGGLFHLAFEARVIGAGIVPFLQPQQALAAAEPGVQFVVAARHFGLAREPIDLDRKFVADVAHPRQVVSGVGQAVLGLAPSFLVLGDAGRLLQVAAQLLGLGLDDARDHALLDDRVGARAQAGAEEQVDDVAAADVEVVDVVAGIALAVEDALDRDFGVLRPLAAGPALGVVEDQFDAGPAHRLAAARAVEDHVLHRFAAQRGGLGFAQHPAHRVDDVGLAAAVGADHADQLAGEQHRGGIDEGLESGEFELGQAHVSVGGSSLG
ncbi:hypothetical protein GALL_170850 [mine drainage metagenome]|uniref:Uncharacterized protein n=1 Tax=mine drainage metagenome TaxID=410659 RepID=A0A1J5SA58_9ZZZZ